MRLRLAIAALLTFTATTAAGAQQLSGIGANLFGSHFNFRTANLSAQPVTDIAVGGLNVRLQRTTLAEVNRRLGGTIMSGGGATWLCYHAEGTNTWLISNALGGQEFVMMVAVETATRMPAGCEAASASFTVPVMGIPGLGAATADLRAAFGSASGNTVSYRHDRPGGYSDTAQYIGYMLRSGKVTAYGVGEASVPASN